MIDGKLENVRFERNGVEFEPTKNELKIVLDEYAKKNAELEKALEELKKDAVLPKFKTGDRVWYLDFIQYHYINEVIKNGTITTFYINTASEVKLYYNINTAHSLIGQDYIFNTRKEAKLKLEEMRKMYNV